MGEPNDWRLSGFGEWTLMGTGYAIGQVGRRFTVWRDGHLLDRDSDTLVGAQMIVATEMSMERFKAPPGAPRWLRR